jgi:hypothetical protein
MDLPLHQFHDHADRGVLSISPYVLSEIVGIPESEGPDRGTTTMQESSRWRSSIGAPFRPFGRRPLNSLGV